MFDNAPRCKMDGTNNAHQYATLSFLDTNIFQKAEIFEV